MHATEQIWIETTPGGDEPGAMTVGAESRPPGSGWHAQFAARIHIEPWAARSKRKWGFNNGALLDEALERQRMFIESQHFSGEVKQEPPARRTLALRCLRDPAIDGIKLTLLGKVRADSQEAASQQALTYWDEIRSIFPYEYRLEPADQAHFQQLAGWDWLREAGQLASMNEVGRLEEVVATGQERFYLLGSWSISKFANEQFWRALAGARQRVLFNVTLRPTVLLDIDYAVLNAIAQYIDKIGASGIPVNIQHYATYAAQHYHNLLEALRRPYLIQVHLVAPDGVPEYLPRVIGYAATHLTDRTPATPGFKVSAPRNVNELENWRTTLLWLEPEVCLQSPHSTSSDVRFTRLRLLVDAHEANTLFRLPFPPENGFGGITFPEIE